MSGNCYSPQFFIKCCQHSIFSPEGVIAINIYKFTAGWGAARPHTFLILLVLLINSVCLSASEADQIQSLIARGELRQALSVTDKELLRDDKSVTFRFLKGLILTRMDELDKASEVFLELTQEHPDLPEPYNNLAVIYASQGKFDQARAALKQAISTHPTYATAHENMGDIYAKMASKAYNQALQLDADNSSAKAKLALVNDLFFVPKNEKENMELVARADEATKQAREEQAKAVRAAEEAEKAAQEAEAAKRELAMLKEKQAKEEKQRVDAEKAAQEAEAAKRELAMLKEKQAEEEKQRLEKERAERERAVELAKEQARQEALALEKARREEEQRQAETVAMAEKEARQEAEKISQQKAERETKDRADVTSTVNRWAASWSAQDAEAYISFYGREFSPPKRLSRSAWEEQRRVRLAKPSYIKVTVSDIRVSLLGDSHAQATFQQKYESNT